jgi:hypothetical protein
MTFLRARKRATLGGAFRTMNDSGRLFTETSSANSGTLNEETEGWPDRAPESRDTWEAGAVPVR